MKEYKYKINGNPFNVIIGDIEDNIVRVEVNGTPYKVELEKTLAAPKKKIASPAAAPRTSTGAPVVSAPSPAKTAKGGVKSPLPGVVLDIHVAVGDVVKKGQLIVTLEAMKMENNINSDRDGKIAAINVNKGDSVLEGADLVIIE